MTELTVEYLDNDNVTLRLYELKESGEREIVADMTTPSALKDAVNDLDSGIYQAIYGHLINGINNWDEATNEVNDLKDMLAKADEDHQTEVDSVQAAAETDHKAKMAELQQQLETKATNLQQRLSRQLAAKTAIASQLSVS
jgi:hypothetical protein